jgi:RHS repeat-associated protein
MTNLDRLVTASGTAANTNICWQYDDWGNRTYQHNADTAFTFGTDGCTTTGTLGPTTWANYDTSNRITQQSTGVVNGPSYDASGEMTDDGANTYLYDAEGRICASRSSTSGTITGYIYDAEGNRIAKGSLQSFSCDITQNGFAQNTGYVVGPSGEQLTEIHVNGSNTLWEHTNVSASGKLIATYDGLTDAPQLHFHLSDPLGTRRVQTNAAGFVEATYESLPYGDGFQAISAPGFGDDPTENHFTGKERDSESGNDYMFARYYNSSTGRFLSPTGALK